MVTSLFEHERIVTTTPKAKEARCIVEKMITLAKRNDLHAKRQAFSYIRSKDIVAKLFDVIRLQFVDRNGGYTRIIQTGKRQGDAASMAILELVGYQEKIETPSDN
jgi:large subunit ribosomal protein L17